MAKPLDSKNDSRSYRAAERAFTSPGGYLAQVEADLPLDAGRRLMAEFSIHYDGRCYVYNGYHYDRLADAIGYARLVHTRSAPHDLVHPFRRAEVIEAPNEADRKLMAELSISFEAGQYEFEGFRYDHLADAANYAYMHRRTEGHAS